MSLPYGITTEVVQGDPYCVLQPQHYIKPSVGSSLVLFISSLRTAALYVSDQGSLKNTQSAHLRLLAFADR